MAMRPSAEPPIRFRQLGPGDKDAVARLAAAAFHGNSFYEKALGLDARRLDLYWHAFFDLSLGDPGAAVFGLEQDGELKAATAMAFDGFPKIPRALRYLWTLHRHLGTGPLMRYLRFVRAYERAMKRPAWEPGSEARGLWLFVKPTARKAGLGSHLVKYAIEAVRARGKTLVTGFIDASNRPLDRYYRSLGFTVSSPFPFAGLQAACIELRLEPMAREVPTATLHESIADIDRADWDGLGSDPLSSHAVLATLEQAALPGIRTWCATIEDLNGRVIAAAPIARIEVDAERLTHGLFRALIKAARKLHPGFLRTALMICGTPLSVGNPPVRLGQGLDFAAILGQLAGLLERLGKREGAPWLAFKEFPVEQLETARRALAGNGSPWFIAPSEPNSVLPIEWSSYEEYLGNLRSHYRYKIRSASRALAGDGVSVDVVPLAEGYDKTLHPLYEAVVDRAAVQLERLTPEFFIALGQAYGDAAQLIRFVRDGRVIGWIAMLVSEDAAYDLFHGIDYAENDRTALYFNQLAEVVRFSIRSGARRVSLGQSTEVAKARFGARSVPLWVAVRHLNPIVGRLLRLGRRFLFPAKQVPPRHVFRQPSQSLR